MKYAVEKLGKKDARFGLIYQDDDFGANNKLGYERAVKEFGLKSVVEIPYKRGQKDFSAEMLRVQKEKVDFLVSCGIIAENVAIFKEAKKLGMTDLRVSTVWNRGLYGGLVGSGGGAVRRGSEEVSHRGRNEEGQSLYNGLL